MQAILFQTLVKSNFFENFIQLNSFKQISIMKEISIDSELFNIDTIHLIVTKLPLHFAFALPLYFSSHNNEICLANFVR